ncbi:hypothetical protein CDAR_257171 [Caerostris darwini]|uniref:Tudor domain-containing protein n=1 Tax=Caerostris darwini TaxID=1538125 RepID=A0AAV4Q1A4_9ARAC|nr:hypothetical protein CDAR_257171 [Caerostris darwini]
MSLFGENDHFLTLPLLFPLLKISFTSTIQYLLQKENICEDPWLDIEDAPNIDALKKTLPLNCITCVGPICIVSPGRILVQILSEDFWTLKDFTDSLTSTCDHFPPPNMPYVKEGDLCVYRRDDFNFWCRVKVVNVLLKMVLPPLDFRITADI